LQIKISNLTMEYKKGVYALDNINLDIGNGMFGLLGQNGAGKTTLMRILTTLQEPSSGQVIINNVKLDKKNGRLIKNLVGYLPQEFGMYPNLTVYECLDYFSILSRICSSNRKELIYNILEKVNLVNEKGKKIKHLSGGMKRRLGLAQALINNPQILIVDEPTAGLDPEERIRLRNLLNDISKDKTVILSTHIVEDVAITCRELAILEKGKIKYCGSVKKLIEKTEGNVWRCNIPGSRELEEMRKEHLVLSNIYMNDYIEARILGKTKPSMNAELISPSFEDAYMLVCKKEL
jgi:ABC-2 type transport system ATP-binding protein